MVKKKKMIFEVIIDVCNCGFNMNGRRLGVRVKRVDKINILSQFEPFQTQSEFPSVYPVNIDFIYMFGQIERSSKLGWRCNVHCGIL